MPLPEGLRDELVLLRRGRGVHESPLADRLGPLLRELGDVRPQDHDRAVRQKIRDVLAELAAELPDDLRAAAEHALALGARPATQLAKRIEALAEQIHCSERTARRRMDEAAASMARAAAERADTAAETDPGPDWRVRSFTALLRLDTAGPELYETRLIVAERPLDRVVIRLDLPPLPDGGPPPPPLETEAIYGARVVNVDRGDAGRHYRLTVALPRTLQPEERTEFCLHYRVPPGRPIRDHYAIVPLAPCDQGRVRVRFAVDRPPAAVWPLSAVAPRQLDRATAAPGSPLLIPDGAGEVALGFRGLRQGHGYGLAWLPAPARPPS